MGPYLALPPHRNCRTANAESYDWQEVGCLEHPRMGNAHEMTFHIRQLRLGYFFGSDYSNKLEDQISDVVDEWLESICRRLIADYRQRPPPFIWKSDR